MRKVTITLGEEEFDIFELSSRRNEVWRKELAGAFGGLAEILTVAPGLKLDNPQELSELVALLKAGVIGAAGSMETIKGLLFGYSPELAAKQETILESCYDSQIVEAFARVLTLAYPFGAVMGMVGDLGRKIGSKK